MTVRSSVSATLPAPEFQTTQGAPRTWLLRAGDQQGVVEVLADGQVGPHVCFGGPQSVQAVRTGEGAFGDGQVRLDVGGVGAVGAAVGRVVGEGREDGGGQLPQWLLRDGRQPQHLGAEPGGRGEGHVEAGDGGDRGGQSA